MSSRQAKTIHLLISLILCILLAGWLGNTKVGIFILSLTFLLITVLSIKLNPIENLRAKIFIIVLIVGFVSNFIYTLQLPNASKELIIFSYITYCFYFLRSIKLISVNLFLEEKVTIETIQKALCIYLLAGILWGMLFRVIDILDSQAFSSPSHNNYPYFYYIYFSFTTITTTGYGDITPINPLAMGLTNLEALFGIMFPAILIARLVSLYQRN